jgi:hypothetical protein
VGGVVVERNRCVVRVRKLEVGNIGTVNLELELVIIIEDRESRAVRRGKILDWVVEVQLLDFRTRRDRLLDLGNDHVLGLGSEHFTLLSIEVRVVRVDVPLLARIGGSGTPSDAKLDIVVLERYERESRLPVLTESEAERIEALIGGATIEIAGNRL